MKFHTNKFFLFGFFLFWICLSFSQASLKWDEDGPPAIPSIQTSLYDFADIIPDDKEDFLENKLIRYSDSTSTQIVIVTVPELKDRNINFFATEWAHKWGIGQKGKDNGIFILVAPNDKKVAISTGYGVEYKLTDAMSRRIIETYMIPYFKKGDYFSGLNAATEAIFKILKGEFKDNMLNREDVLSFWDVLIIILIVLIILWILTRISKGKGGRGYTIDNPGGPVIWGGGSGSFGGGFDGGFGGGFSGGFGGGGFGGGGASGSW